MRYLALMLSALVLTGCTSLLERQYSTAEPHSSKFWESEAADILRAESYQDIVNDLLVLIGEHTESATIRLYEVEGDVVVADMLERAAVEIQQETPLGAYAVEYITSTSQAQRGYYEIQVEIGYRRTAEQLQAVVNTSSPAAVYGLLESALQSEKTELAVRIGYWGQDGQVRVEDAMGRLREARGLTEETVWLVHYYPAEGPVGLVEFLLNPSEEDIAAAQAQLPQDLPEEIPEGHSESVLEDTEADTEISEEEKSENLEQEG